jgi:hypothetical protein
MRTVPGGDIDQADMIIDIGSDISLRKRLRGGDTNIQLLIPSHRNGID